jgi:hypothetical protein
VLIGDFGRGRRGGGFEIRLSSGGSDIRLSNGRLLCSFSIVVGHELINDELESINSQSKLSSTSEMTAERRPLKITHLAQRGNEEQRIGALFPLSVPNEETPRGVSGTTDVH